VFDERKIVDPYFNKTVMIRGDDDAVMNSARKLVGV
jgi:hypothetical protein